MFDAIILAVSCDDCSFLTGAGTVNRFYFVARLFWVGILIEQAGAVWGPAGMPG